MPITIMGAGAAGIGAAINLAKKYPHETILLIDKGKMGEGSSGRNPGREGHGFHYADKETSLAYLRASIKVQRAFPNFIIGRRYNEAGEEIYSPFCHGRYIITRDSTVPREDILANYAEIQKEYARLVAEDPANKVFGEPDQFYRILKPEEYEGLINKDIVDCVVETNECLFNWQEFIKSFRENELKKYPNIQLIEDTEVTSLEKNEAFDGNNARFIIKTRTKDGQEGTIHSDFIVNSTWQQIKYFNEMLGIEMKKAERTNRLKALIKLKLPEELVNANSMFFCMGQHCMISNMGNGYAMGTYAKETNMEMSDGLNISERAQRLIDGGATQEEINDISKKMLEGMAKYIPALSKAEFDGLLFGIIQTLGKLTREELNNPHHAFNCRDDHAVVSEMIGLISNPCMKLFYFLDNGELVTNLLEQQMQAENVITNCIATLKERAEKELFIFNMPEQIKLRSKLERKPLSELAGGNVETIVTQTIAKLKSQQSKMKFLPKKDYSEKSMTKNSEEISRSESSITNDNIVSTWRH
ncbi:FAD dependent oxidoreductase [Legionella birminghamensis]|uniref:FAD dependent oxidoreductase n=1 Tax=Legionella birminghamensis TaxID=28083 RepID=A0A378ICE7_9GAMM|nr:FAD-dependent oxidoreductase [Legionella birminghamensis]KTC66748.1 FAD dependent oxidoreductase [Legionella birminghamensis]STX32897.1 FAD dependent oxidoreductase [Legionella birminghamensis]